MRKHWRSGVRSRYLPFSVARCLLPASCRVVMATALTASEPVAYKYQQQRGRLYPPIKNVSRLLDLVAEL